MMQKFYPSTHTNKRTIKSTEKDTSQKIATTSLKPIVKKSKIKVPALSYMLTVQTHKRYPLYQHITNES